MAGIVVLHDWTTYVFGGIVVAGCLGVLYYFEHCEFAKFDEPNEQQFNDPEIKSGASRFASTTPTLDRDMFVVYRVPGLTEPHLARIVAMGTGVRPDVAEGDKVEIKEEDVFVNGTVVKAPVPNRKHSTLEVPTITVPRGCVYVISDERAKGNSVWNDSRVLGPIPVEAISHAFRPAGKGH